MNAIRAARSAFASFIRKEFFHIVRDKRTLLILLGIPVVQIILFGFAISTEMKNIRVAILAPVRDDAVRQIANRIDASEYFSVTAWLDSPADAERAFQQGIADFVIAFGAPFADRLYVAGGAQIQWMPDATDTNTATTMVMYASEIVRAWLTEQQSLTPHRGVTPHVQMLYNPQMKSAYNFVPGVMGLILMLICAMMTSISIVREKETGTMETLLASPVKPLHIIVAKMVPYLALSCVNFATILTLAVCLLGVPLGGNLLWISLVSLIYIAVALALGLLISTVARTQTMAMLLSAAVLMLPVIMLSGMIFPIESIPYVLQLLSCVMPARWYIAAIRKLMIEGLPVAFVGTELAVLGGMALFLIVISLKKFKYRLE